MSREPIHIQRNAVAKGHVDDVVLLLDVGIRAVRNRLDGLARWDNALTVEKADRQFEIVARRSHGDRDTVRHLERILAGFAPIAVVEHRVDDPDLHRFLGDNDVHLGGDRTWPPSDDAPNHCR